MPREGNNLLPKYRVIGSNESELQLREGKTYPTDCYLNEFTVPVKLMVDRGYDIVLANPKGDTPKTDMRSDSPEHFGNDAEVYQLYREFHDGIEGLRNPKKISTIIEKGLAQYAAVFFPGGHAPMVDLIQNKDVGIILNYFHQEGKPAAFICHGPIALISTVQNAEALAGPISGDTGKIESNALFALLQRSNCMREFHQFVRRAGFRHIGRDVKAVGEFDVFFLTRRG